MWGELALIGAALHSLPGLLALQQLANLSTAAQRGVPCSLSTYLVDRMVTKRALVAMGRLEEMKSRPHCLASLTC